MPGNATRDQVDASDTRPVDPELGTRVRQLAGEYGAVHSYIRAALELLPEAAADIAEFPTEHSVCSC